MKYNVANKRYVLLILSHHCILYQTVIYIFILITSKDHQMDHMLSRWMVSVDRTPCSTMMMVVVVPAGTLALALIVDQMELFVLVVVE